MLIGCVEKEAVNNIGSIDTLINFFPEYPFTWEYEGSGSYYHIMSIDKINVYQDGINYLISGEVISEKNPSNFDDYLLSIRYILTDKGIRQEKQEKKMIDSKYNSLYILKFPIEKGNSWTEKVIDDSGSSKTLECSIVDIQFQDGKKIIKIRYNEKYSDYYEIREIMEKKGIISFEKNIKYKNDNFNISYNLKDHNINIENGNGKNDDELAIRIFLNKFNNEWEKHFNTKKSDIFTMISEDSRLNEMFKEIEISEVKIEFKELEVLEINKANDKYYVLVSEKYIKRLGDKEQFDESITEYIIDEFNGKYIIENYVNK